MSKMTKAIIAIILTMSFSLGSLAVYGDSPQTITSLYNMIMMGSVVSAPHALVGDRHTATGLTAGQVLRATSPTGFAFATIQTGDLPSDIDAAKIANGTVSNTEFQYLDGVTVAIQGQLNGKISTYGSQTANYFLAAPNGSPGTPSFRAVVAADIPALNQNTSGTAAGAALWGLYASITGPSQARTYTFPDSAATILTTNAVVTAAQGGTGQSSYAVGDLLYASASNALSKLADVAIGSYLRSGGITTAPLWSTLILPNAATAFRLPVATSANTIGELAAVGATGEYLKGNTGAIPSWATLNQAAVAGLTTADGPSFAHLHLADVAAIYTAAESWVGPSSTAGIYFKGGFVGIGTTSPGQKLEVLGNIKTTDGTYLSTWYPSTNVSSLNPGTTAIATLLEGATAQHLIFDLKNNDAADSIAFRYSAANNNVVDTIGFVFKGNGNVGIGTTSPSAILDVVGTVQFASFGAGTATFDASGNISSVSDERLKIIQGKYTGGIAQLNGIEPIVHKWNEKSGMEMDHEYVGFSAQNVQANMPEAVYENKDGYLSFNDRAVLAAAVNAIKELNTKIAIMKIMLIVFGVFLILLAAGFLFKAAALEDRVKKIESKAWR